MAPEFNEFDEVFIISELREYVRDNGNPLPPKTQTILNIDRPTHDLVHKHAVSKVLQRLVQEEKKRFMSELEGKVSDVLRQTIF